MMTHRLLTRTLLLTCSLSLLSACDSMGETWANITGERASEQVVDGPRRAPVLNPKTQAPRASAPMVMQVVTPAPAPAPAQEATPSLFSLNDEEDAPQGGVDYNAFDRFDEKGNEVVSKAEQPKLPPVEEGPRKAFPGNPSYSTHTEPTAPIPPAPLMPPSAPQAELEAPAAAAPQPLLAQGSEAAPAMAMSPAADAEDVVLAQAQPAPSAPDAPVVAEAAKAPPASPGFFARVKDSIGVPFAASSAEAATAAPQEKPAPSPNSDYPKLANVPPTPEAFKEMRAEQKEKITDLQTEHALAQESRQALESEPSQLEAEPLESIAPAAAAPQPAAVAAPLVQAQAEPQSFTLSAAPEPQPSEAQPVLLGQASAPVASENTLALPETLPGIAPAPSAPEAPATAPEAEAERAAEAPAEKPQGNAVTRWFNSLPPLFGNAKPAAPSAPEAPAPSTDAAVVQPEQPIASPQPEPLNDAAPTLRSASGDVLPSLRPQPAPVAPVVAQDALVPEAPAPLLQVAPATPAAPTTSAPAPVAASEDDEANENVLVDPATMAATPATALPSPQLLRGSQPLPDAVAPQLRP